MDKTGPWVLLDSYVDEEDLSAKRGCFIFSRGLFVKKSDTERLVSLLVKCDPHGRIPEIPADYYTFGEEIPWSEYFHYNGTSEIEFLGEKIKKKEIVKKIARLPDGSLISEQELLSFLLDNYSHLKTDNKEIKNMLKDQKIEMINESIVEEEIEVNERPSYEVFVPVRSYRWESYHSSTNESGNVNVLSKEVTDYFNLCSQPQTFSLYQKNGVIASLSLQYKGTTFGNQQNLTYLRRDLLNKYLKDNGYDLVWIIWGEREFRANGMEGFNERRAYAATHPGYKTFKHVCIYGSSQENNKKVKDL